SAVYRLCAAGSGPDAEGPRGTGNAPQTGAEPAIRQRKAGYRISFRLDSRSAELPSLDPHADVLWTVGPPEWRREEGRRGLRADRDSRHRALSTSAQPAVRVPPAA